LLSTGKSSPEKTDCVVKYCHAIVENNPTEFKLEDMKEFCAVKLIELIHETIDEMVVESSRVNIQKMTVFLDELVKKSLLTQSGIVKIWKAVSEHLVDKWFIAQYLVAIISKSLTFVEVLDTQEMRDDVTAVKKALRPHLTNARLKKIQKDLKQVSRNLEDLLETDKDPSQTHEPPPSQPSTSGQAAQSSKSRKPKRKGKSKASNASEKAPEVDDTFKFFVEMVSSGKFFPSVYKITDAKTHAEYYLNYALRDQATATKLGGEAATINHDEFIFKLLELVETRFKKQHDPVTQDQFSDEEVKAMICFINQLYLGKVIGNEMLSSYMKILKVPQTPTNLTCFCVEMMEQNFRMAQEKWNSKRIPTLQDIKNNPE
jgi:hypothetical protein